MWRGGAHQHQVLTASANVLLWPGKHIVTQCTHGSAAALVAVMRRPGKAGPLLELRKVMCVQPIKEATARIVGEIVPSCPDTVVHAVFVRTFAASGGALLPIDRCPALVQMEC
jgi:hypothetical protein